MPLNTRILALLLTFGLTPVVTAQNAVLITTFTNPVPDAYELFGGAVVAIGSDRVLIGAATDHTGASGAGSVYLYSTNGNLITTITNPAPAHFDGFGGSLAVVGNQRILIGAPADDTGATDAGTAYLFSTNGTLLTTITNPTPALDDQFGVSVAALGHDLLIIGAYKDDSRAIDAGAAYLFDLNGSLLTTFANPTPQRDDYFGNAVAGIGSDRVLVAAYSDNTGAGGAGAVYLFGTNGVLLTTITNPVPATGDGFGYSLAVAGNDQVLVGAHGNDTFAPYAGEAYLITTNGTLLSTFLNPSPAISDYFGGSVAAMGNDRVLISAFGDSTGADSAGSVYVFSTNGLLLNTITNPTPAPTDLFGRSVTMVGSDLVLVGVYSDNTGDEDAGAAYLFFLPPPTLAISRAATVDTTISWLPNTPGFVLQETQSLSPANWTNSLTGATNPTDVPTNSQRNYFRLIRP